MNHKQVGGNHYKIFDMEPVFIIAHYKLNWFQGEILKYISRFRNKNGKQDLDKALSISDIALRFDNNNSLPVTYKSLDSILKIYVKQFEQYFNESISYSYFTEAVLAILNEDYRNLNIRILPNLIYCEYGDDEL